jgi:hypothetical protein
LDALTELYGAKTRVVEVAIDRLFNSEIPQEENKMTTRTVVARGSGWSASSLYDASSWGDEIDDETATKLGNMVVQRFHELCEAHGGGDIYWEPQLSEVTAEVVGEGHRMWERVHPMDEELEILRQQAGEEVWAVFCDDTAQLQGDVPDWITKQVREIWDRMEA